ncbi:MAG: hypothetical protein GXP62_18320, partial [Oligoflexia bacterium]|nr:hypothetical protein [Oligoflexia bacterium]
HRGPLPLSLAIARLRMAAQPPDDSYQRPARLAADVDRGRPLPDGVWSEPGVAGLLALEGAAAQRVDLLPTLLDLAVDGPSPGDRIAALFAAQRLADVRDWPADHPAVARLRKLER